MMLGKKDDRQSTPLLAVKPQDLASVAPSEYGYSALSPLFERVAPYDDLSLGYGLKIQETFHDRRYHYALNADLSVSGPGPWLKGPDVTAFTPATTDATNGISAFFEMSSELYALAGRYVLKRVSDSSWTVAKDLGVGTVATDVAVFTSNGSGTTYAMVAMGDAVQAWHFDGVTWAQFPTFTALCWLVRGTRFYRASDVNEIAMVDTDADPTVEANWTADNAYRIGDKTAAITRMALTATGTPVFIKTDGLYSVDEEGQDIAYFAHLRAAPDADNGKANGLFLNDLYIAFRDGTYRLSPDFQLDPIGPERLSSNDSIVTGRTTAFLGWQTLHAYSAIWDVDTSLAHVLKFGAWVQGEGGESKRIDAWHGSITPSYGVKIQTMFASTEGAPTGYARLYLGMANGTMKWFTLPNTPNPAASASYTFSTADAQVYLPTFHGQFANDPKSMRGITVGGLNLDAGDYAQIEYKTDPNGAWDTFGQNFDTTPLEFRQFENGVSGGFIDFKVVLVSTVTTSCPQVTNVGVHFQIRPALYVIYEMDVLCCDGLVTLDGTPVRRSGARFRDACRAVVNAPSSVQCILPTEHEVTVTGVDFSEGLAFNERTRQWQSAVHLRLTEVKPNTDYSLLGRLSAMTLGDLQGYSLGGLAGL
jgi:hypothetical protein